jgi:hypothetical protein
MKEMLDRLKVADPETYSSYLTSVKSIRFEVSDGLGKLNAEKCNHVISIAILQDSLQRAIEARGWGLQQFLYMGGSDRCVAAIFDEKGRMFEVPSDNMAASLLTAYLEALEA